MLYRLFMPKQATGANLVYFDFFNATGSCANVELLRVVPVVSGAVGVTGVVGVDLHLTRTTAIGTGGTAATREGTALDTATFCALDHGQPLYSAITARLTPTGGGTAGATLAWGCVFTEETSAASYWPLELIRGVTTTVLEGTGFRVVQGAVASVGNIGFDVLFNVIPKT